MKRNTYGIQVITRGAIVERETFPETAYLIETLTIRLGPDLLNEWIMSRNRKTRDNFKPGPEGAAEWVAYGAERAEQRWAWREKIIDALGLTHNGDTSGISIEQAISEIFTVVQIRPVSEV